jgi:lipoate-protein ligase B
VGINASKWITMHGFSLNVSPDLAAFDNIIPCGIKDKGVCSMQQVGAARNSLAAPTDMRVGVFRQHVPSVCTAEVRAATIAAIGSVFDMHVEVHDALHWKPKDSATAAA